MKFTVVCQWETGRIMLWRGASQPVVGRSPVRPADTVTSF